MPNYRYNAGMRFLSICFSFSLVLAAAGPAYAFSECFDQAGVHFGISPVLLKSIAAHESGFNPTAIGRNSDGTDDIGLMQINSVHLPMLSGYGITRAHLFEPCQNIKVGAWMLAKNINRYGNTWEAVGAYNVGCKNLSREECVRRRSHYVALIQHWMFRMGAFQ